MGDKGESQSDILLRLKKIEGQIRGISKMVERDCCCEDIVTQLAAVKSAMNRVSFLFISAHMQECILQNGKNGLSQEESLEKLTKLFLKLS